MYEINPATIAGTELVLELLKGREPALSEGWSAPATDIGWPNQTVRDSFRAFAHPDPTVVRAVQSITCYLTRCELSPGMDTRFLFVPVA
ncbi:MAG TPA: hypothetical protein VFT59_03250 [Candidatus Saccharimonadales bacterium]|nr:hypothetical protein [Candidatus Saccharimonadales bacterium]